MPVILVQRPEAVSGLGSALSGLGEALRGYQRYKADERKFRMKEEEMKRISAESEIRRKEANLRTQIMEDQKQKAAEEEDIARAGETQALISDAARSGMFRGNAQPDFGNLTIATDIGTAAKPAPLIELPGTASKQPLSAVDEAAGRAAAAPALAALERFTKLAPTERSQARRIQQEQANKAAMEKQVALDRLKDTMELPEDTMIGGVLHKKGTRVPIWSVLRTPPTPTTKAVYDNQTKKTVYRTEAQIAEGGDRYSPPKETTGAGPKSTKAVYDNVTKKDVFRTDEQIIAGGDRYGPPRRAGGEGGRPLLAGEANQLKELRQGLNAAQDLKKAISGVGDVGLLPGLKAMAPDFITQFTGVGGPAKQRQATIMLVKQIIGKGLEGGVLRKEDEYKYEKILPKISDAPEVAMAKIDQLIARLSDNAAAQLDTLEAAGRDTAAMRALFAPPKGKAEDTENPIKLDIKTPGTKPASGAPVLTRPPRM